MSNLARFLIILGVLIALIGAGLAIFPKIKIPFLGKLPGDMVIQKKDFVFYFPLTSCVIVSIIITLILYFFYKK